MGILDRAKKLAEQAIKTAEQAKDKAEEALADARARVGPSSTGGSSGAPATEAGDPRWGTPYVPGMLGRPGWRERGLTDPAAVLPIEDRDRAGVPRSTKSEIVEEPYGMGRRWTAGERSVGLFYQLYPEHQAWSVAEGAPGRTVVFVGEGEARVVLETAGLDEVAQAALARSVADHLG